LLPVMLAMPVFDAKNDSFRQPALNLNIARAYLAGADSGFAISNANPVQNVMGGPPRK